MSRVPIDTAQLRRWFEGAQKIRDEEERILETRLLASQLPSLLDEIEGLRKTVAAMAASECPECRCRRVADNVPPDNVVPIGRPWSGQA